jgi:hypothetical protein
VGVEILNPFTYFRLKREAKRRKKAAIILLMRAGTIRSADQTVRYEMTPKEFKKLMQGEGV